MNHPFAQSLAAFEYAGAKKAQLKKILLEKLKSKFTASIEEGKVLKKKISEKQGQLDTIEEKFILGSIAQALYEKFASKYKEEIDVLTKELQNSGVESSNLEMAVEKCLAIAQNLRSAWLSASFENKQRLQRLVFPEDVLYEKGKGVVRTNRANTLFAEIPPPARVSAEKKKRQFP